MSAETITLRAAAALMRQGSSETPGYEDRFMLAVADWLTTAGADLWAHGLPDGCETCGGCDECDDLLHAPHVRNALAVARAYLGEVAP